MSPASNKGDCNDQACPEIPAAGGPCARCAAGHDPRTALRQRQPAQRVLGGVLSRRCARTTEVGVSGAISRGFAARFRRHPLGGCERLVHVAGLLDAGAGLRFAVAGRAPVCPLASRPVQQSGDPGPVRDGQRLRLLPVLRRRLPLFLRALPRAEPDAAGRPNRHLLPALPVIPALYVGVAALLFIGLRAWSAQRGEARA